MFAGKIIRKLKSHMRRHAFSIEGGKTNGEHDLWIFLSHSNKDYELVRKVRNLLEEQGKRPLMFFLKCLDDDDEIFELIKREIDARQRFILCKSRNTEDPDGWVQKEFRYIQGQNKPYEIVDLENRAALEKSAARLVRRSRVFISHARRDHEIARLLREELGRNSFEPFDVAEDIKPGGDWVEEIDSMLTTAAREGYVLVLCSQDSMKSQYVDREIQLAADKEGFIIPCVIDNSHLETGDPGNSLLGNRQWVDASTGTAQEKVQRIVSELKKIDVGKNIENPIPPGFADFSRNSGMQGGKTAP